MTPKRERITITSENYAAKRERYDVVAELLFSGSGTEDQMFEFLDLSFALERFEDERTDD